MGNGRGRKITNLNITTYFGWIPPKGLDKLELMCYVYIRTLVLYLNRYGYLIGNRAVFLTSLPGVEVVLNSSERADFARILPAVNSLAFLFQKRAEESCEIVSGKGNQAPSVACKLVK